MVWSVGLRLLVLGVTAFEARDQLGGIWAEIYGALRGKPPSAPVGAPHRFEQNTADDRILLSGGGRSYEVREIDLGGEPTALSPEILLPPGSRTWRPSPRVAPPIHAKVNAVDPKEKLVVLSAGKDQKVENGYEFLVYRGGQFVGKVQVIKVYPDLSGARILFAKDGMEIEQGDSATTSLN